MPRINIEDEWFDDPRRELLGSVVGPMVADGLALRMWRLAQTYFRLGLLVPEELFDRVPFAKEFEAAGLAERKPEGGIYIKGQSDRFDWLKKRSEAGEVGGKAKVSSKLGSPQWARDRLNQAVRAGKVVRAKSCERCESTGKLDAHHFDYDRPLDVEWLCKSCHNRHHAAPGKHNESQRIIMNHNEASSSSSSSSSSSPSEKNIYNTGISGIQECISEWGRTLEHYRIPRDPKFDEISIARLIQSYKSSERVRHALAGQRSEGSTKDYDPAKNISIHRFTKQNIFMKLELLGSQLLAEDSSKSNRDAEMALSIKAQSDYFERKRLEMIERSKAAEA